MSSAMRVNIETRYLKGPWFAYMFGDGIRGVSSIYVGLWQQRRTEIISQAVLFGSMNGPSCQIASSLHEDHQWCSQMLPQRLLIGSMNGHLCSLAALSSTKANSGVTKCSPGSTYRINKRAFVFTRCASLHEGHGRELKVRTSIIRYVRHTLYF